MTLKSKKKTSLCQYLCILFGIKKRILLRGKGSILTVAHCFSFGANILPSTLDHWVLLTSSGYLLTHHAFDQHCSDNAHYIRVLRSSRKSPITHTQHLLFLHLLTGWFSFFSSQLQCHFYREPFLPPTPTSKGVTNMVFLCLDFSAGHSQFAPISPIHPWEAEPLILDHQDSPSSQFLLGPTDDRQRQKLGGREKTEAGHVLHAPFCWVSVLGGGSSSGGPNCSCLAWAHLVSSSIIPSTFSVPFTGSANPASIQAAFSLNSLCLN